MPDNVHVSMSINLIFLKLLCHSQLIAILRVLVCPCSAFFLRLLPICFLLVNGLNSFLCSDNFPFHLESILS